MLGTQNKIILKFIFQKILKDIIMFPKQKSYTRYLRRSDSKLSQLNKKLEKIYNDVEVTFENALLHAKNHILIKQDNKDKIIENIDKLDFMV
jgi:hypothetical protein